MDVAMNIDKNRLRSVLESIEEVEDEIRSKMEDRKALYAQAKASEFDPKILKRLLRERRRDQLELQLEEDTLAGYRRTLAQ
jgi:uncharacterized protein (UPF0335 family)